MIPYKTPKITEWTMLSITGARAEFSSVTFIKVFVKEAIEFVKKHPEYTASVISIESNSEL